MEAYRAVFNGSRTMGMFTGEEKADPRVTEFLFASFQTMHGHRNLFTSNAFDMVVVDESHHSQAETFRPTVEYFQPKYLLGMTATPDREDGLDIGDLFGEPTATLTLQEAVARRYLSDIDYKLMTVGTAARDAINELKRRVMSGERITLRELNDEVFIHRLDEEIAEEIMSYKAQGIIFCTSIEQAEGMATRLRKARPYHSRLDRKTLDANLEGFRRGRIKYLLVKDMFNEGIDVPDTELIVFLRSTESRTIYLQQLGRGLRKTATKSHVTVLDFVGNCDRISIATAFVEEVQALEREYGERHSSSINASSIIFNLDEESRDLRDILQRIEVDFYSFSEAMEVVRRMGVKSQHEYKARYKEDPRLPSDPSKIYAASWISLFHFLTGTQKANFYSFTEAMEAVQRMSVKTQPEYKARYKEDSRLPSTPEGAYASSWMSWTHFLTGTQKANFYSFTEAMEVVQRMGVKSVTEYRTRYKEDTSLPSNPNAIYASSWITWPHFLTGTQRAGFYPFLEAMEVVQRLGVKSVSEYSARYKEDSRLPCEPNKIYISIWISWTHFLTGTQKASFYPFLEAMEVVQRMGIKNGAEYKARYKEDSRLPCEPNKIYASSWTSWSHFCTGTQKASFYPFLEAMEAVQRMGVKTQREYQAHYKEDSQLPSNPNAIYASSWISWPHFLGKKK